MRFGRRPPRRFGPRLHVPTEPRRWEVCNVVFTTQTVVDPGESTFTSVVALAQIADHFGDADTEQGRALNNAARFLEVGGIVFSYRLNLSTAAVVQNQGSGAFALNRFDHRILLCSDRLSAGGAPNSIPNWFTAGTPLVAVTGLTPANEDVEYPTRIHWQDRLQHNPNFSLVNSVGAAANPILQNVTNCGRSANLRLRLRLTDTQGLFFHFATRLSDGTSTEVPWVWNCDVIGTMYYRVRF